MKLRKLELKDAPYMLEWMHDRNVVSDLRTPFLEKTMVDCEKFIMTAQCVKDSLHLAVVDENDIYMGTASLKNIKEQSAEFGITIRSIAMGKGYSKYAMEEIFKIGFQEIRLREIYWCVSQNNKRALRFYDKNKFERVNAKLINTIQGYTQNQIDSYIWYLKRNEG